MVAPNLKAETFALMDQRASLESQMNVIIQRLCRPGGPGLSGNLLDAEGFPRADIEIPNVRAERRRLCELRNDHKEITNKIDQNLQILHSGKVGQNTHVSAGNSGVASGSSHDSVSAMAVDQPLNIPFAMVDEITEGSPAAEDGLQLGDQIVKFGSVEIGEDLLPKLASEAQLNQGKQLSVSVMRHGSLINLTVTPRQWHGRGLLGCHFRIL